jgi:ubiquinone/menaquinone biosynthesis C-methylase UbiE
MSVLGEFMVEDDKVLREWDEAAETWANFVREGKDHYRDEMNNPAAFSLIGDINGKRVLDLSCGEGYNTRLLARKGARVVGVDFSEKMIKLAKQKEAEERLGISYHVLNADDLKGLPNDHFDLVTCFMALMDVEQYEAAISEVARVLRKNGKFIFSILHPCFEWGTTTEGARIADWKYEEGTENTPEENALQLEVERYFGTFTCEIRWTMKRLVAPFKTTSFHRTLTDYFQALYQNGLLVARLVEPKPTTTGVSKHPSLRKHTRIPHSLVFEAIKK